MGREAFIWDKTERVISRDSEEKNCFKDSLGRKRRPFFLTPRTGKSFQPASQTSDSRRGKSLIPSLGTYPTKVSSNHRTHRTWICPAFSLWTQFPPRPQQGRTTMPSLSKVFRVPVTLWVPLVSSSIAVEGGLGQRKKHCPISRSTMEMNTLPMSKGQQIDRSNNCPISSLLPAPVLPSLP